MTKVSCGEIQCPNLKRAFDRAEQNAISNKVYPLLGVHWPENYGNAVSNKGCLTGESQCEVCNKKVSVVIQLPKIEGAYDGDGKSVTIYDVIGGKESIKVSGHKCSEDINVKI